MTPMTEAQLNAHIDLLNKEIGQLKEQVEELEGEKRSLTRRLEDDEFGWALPRKMEYNDLPLPRLELEWSDDGSGYNRVCTYMLVYEHFLGRRKIAGNDDAEVVGIVLGRTKQSGGRRTTYLERFVDDETPQIETPFRDWSHALSDMEHLKLPLYITTNNGDISIVVSNQDDKRCPYKQQMLKIGGEAP